MKHRNEKSDLNLHCATNMSKTDSTVMLDVDYTVFL